MTTDDMELLRQYARQQSESAFAALVSRHAGLVYSAALRSVRDPHLAEEITQAVFIILARKAGSLDENTILPGWLYRTSCYVASSARKERQRREQREQKAYMQSTLQPAQTTAAWEQISPLLEEAMLRLGQADRDALVLRFFEGRNFNEVGAALGSSEEAAKKRVTRALEKLHRYFNRRGVSSTTAILAGALAANSVHAAPATLAISVTTAAMAKGAAASGSTLTLIKGALKLMAWAKIKTAMVVGVSVLLAAGAATVTIKEAQRHSAYSWQVFDADVDSTLHETPQQVTLVPTKFPRGATKMGGTAAWSWLAMRENEKAMGMNCTAAEILRYAYSQDTDLLREDQLHLETNSPGQGYDFIANLKTDSKIGLQRELKEKLGLEAHFETRMEDVFILREGTNQAGLKTGELLKGEVTIGAGEFGLSAQTSLTELTQSLNHRLDLPVVNRTTLTNHFNLKLRWPTKEDGSNDELKLFLHNQLGLELVPGRAAVEMLVVEKAK